MPSLTRVLSALAAAAALREGGSSSASCSVEEPAATLLAAHRELAAMDRAVVGRDGVLEPLRIDVYAHVFVSRNSSSQALLSRDALDAQVAVLSRDFAAANISFRLVYTDWIVDAVWAVGDDVLNMKAEHHRGDSTALNLFFVERFRADPTTRGMCSYPDAQFQPNVGPGIDGCIMAAAAVPGAAAFNATLSRGNMVVHEVGHWFGLLHPFGETCDADSDLVDDTPVALKNASVGCPVGRDSCPGQPGRDPIYNHMSYTNDACRREFTPGQARRMHKLWYRFRWPARPALPRELVPLAAVRQAGKLPHYPGPTRMVATYTLCLPDRFNRTRELREEYCGTFVFCYFGLWKLLGPRYVDWWDCVYARADLELVANATGAAGHG